jgi:hypothetical protein
MRIEVLAYESVDSARKKAQELLNDPAIFKVVPAAPESPQIDDLGQSLRDFFLFMTALKE